MPNIRPAAVAGRFYPDEADVLRRQIEELIRDARRCEARPKGIIVPHAGYVYSGPVAATGYAALASRRDEIRRVVLLGPSHFVRVRGLAVPTVDSFATPLGLVRVDTSTVARLLRLPQVVASDEPHAREHSLEVHLPFLQVVLDDFQIVPLAVGDASADEIREIIELLWGGPETAFVISSDLSHFHDHDTASRIDASTSRLIESLQYEQLRGDLCCGYKPISGLLAAARSRGFQVQALDLRNSGDTAGPRDRVVGYGAFVLESHPLSMTVPESEPGSFTAEEQRLLFQTAKDAIAAKVTTGAELEIDPNDYPESLREPRATFVTLRIDGKLRGCMGSLGISDPLIADVAQNAAASATRDPRFVPVTFEEIPRLDIHLSILTPPEPLAARSEQELIRKIRPGIDGLILHEQSKRATLLPAVWENVATVEEFLAHLKRKAHLPVNYWSDTIRFERYTAESLHQPVD
ncbi:MAG: AmmeMemoRadiSam system protein B [Planctomycetaceae bacterium]